MFFTPIESEWGEILFMPTKPGEALLTVIIALSFLLAMIFLSKRGIMISVNKLYILAASIGLGSLLSNVKLYELPTGGTITLLSMLVVALPGYFFGLGAGIMTGIAYGVLQILIDPYLLFPSQIMVDYILAFGAIGLSGIFCDKKYGLQIGYLVGILGRYVFAVISGWIFFGMYAWEGWAPLPYSLAYNASYIFAEGAITLVFISLPPVRRSIEVLKENIINEHLGIKHEEVISD